MYNSDRAGSVIIGALFFCAIFGIIAARAEEIDRGMASCAAVENDVNRLSCFDDLAKQRNVAGPGIETTSKGKWQVQSETSKIDDRTNVFMAVESENEFEGKYGSSQHATMFIACREGQTHLYFQFGDHFMADNESYGEITVRIDKQKATTISTTESTDNNALGLWSGSGVGFLKKLFGKSKLLIRAAPFNESPITVEFQVEGIEAAIAPLRKNCRW